jgi:hypothetical protein
VEAVIRSVELIVHPDAKDVVGEMGVRSGLPATTEFITTLGGKSESSSEPRSI